MFFLGIYCRTNNRKLALFQHGEGLQIRELKMETAALRSSEASWWRQKTLHWKGFPLWSATLNTKSPYYSWLKLVYSSTGALLPLLGLENSLGSSLLPPCLTVCKQVHPGEQNIVITRVTTHWGLLLIRRFLKCFTSAKLFNS